MEPDAEAGVALLVLRRESAVQEDARRAVRAVKDEARELRARGHAEVPAVPGVGKGDASVLVLVEAGVDVSRRHAGEVVVRQHDLLEGALVEADGAGPRRLRGRRRRREARGTHPRTGIRGLPVARTVVGKQARLARGAQADVARARNPAWLRLAVRQLPYPARRGRCTAAAARCWAPLIGLADGVGAARRGARSLVGRRRIGEAVTLRVG